jgi:hypothetical protein
MSPRCLLATALGLLLAAWLCLPVVEPSGASTLTPCAAPLPGSPGISVGSGIQGLSSQDLARELSDLQTLGVRWLRLDIAWSTIQAGGPSAYDWSRYDPPVGGAVAHGMNVDGMLAYTPPWARPRLANSETYPPANPADFSRFAAAAVRHYAPMGVHTWEIWNEPNIPSFWRPQPNVAAYAKLLKQAYVAIKEADPTATVITGGMAASNTTDSSISAVDFLSGLYTEGAGRYFDAVGDHPYTFTSTPPSSSWSEMKDTDPSLRSVMTSKGDGNKQIWVTEYGAPTYPGDATDRQQAAMITSAFQLLRSTRWAGPLFVYTYIDSSANPTTSENFFGLVRTDLSRKPSWGAFNEAANRFAESCSAAPNTGPAPRAPAQTTARPSAGTAPPALSVGNTSPATSGAYQPQALGGQAARASTSGRPPALGLLWLIPAVAGTALALLAVRRRRQVGASARSTSEQ